MLNGRKDHEAWPILRSFRYAHRGFHDKPQIPENSLPAFRRAKERGWGAELDVHLLSDGTLAVFHDSDLKRCTGTAGIIEDLTKEELSQLRLEGTDEKVPLFDEVLEIFEHVSPLIIELKTHGKNHKELAKAVCERLDGYEGDFCLETFDPLCLLEIKRLRPSICRGQLASDFTQDHDGLTPLKRVIAADMWMNYLTKPDFAAYNYKYRQRKALRKIVDKGVQEVSWTVRDRESMHKLEREGCLIIFEKFDPEEELENV